MYSLIKDTTLLNNLNQQMKQLNKLRHYDENLNHKFERRFIYSWLYHENALEGKVLTYHELKSALEMEITTDELLIPTYERLKNHKNAFDFVVDSAKKKEITLNLDFIKKVASLLSPQDVGPKGEILYRKEVPLHRLYVHEISQPEAIPYKMKKLMSWYSKTKTQKEYHPLVLAIELHQKLLHIFPFNYGSGYVARLVMDFLFLKEGYLPVILHVNQRQAYYEYIKKSTADLVELVLYSLYNTIKNAVKFYREEIEEIEKANKRKGSLNKLDG